MAHKLKLHGPVDGFWSGFLSDAVVAKIDGLDGDDLDVHINSPGGYLFGGIAIYQALKDYAGKVTVRIDALAASAASIIAMAGDEIIMGDASVMMIHNPWVRTSGDANKLRKQAEDLDTMREAMIAAYTSQTGKTKEELRALLDDETWMTAEEAVEEGFATKVDGEVDDESAAALAEMKLDQFKNVPAALRDRIAAAVERFDVAARTSTDTQQEADMIIEDKKKKQGGDAGQQPQQAAVAEPTQDPEPQAQAAPAEPQPAQADGQRAARIINACAAGGLDAKFANELIEAKEGGKPISVDEAHKRIFARLAKSDPEPTVNANPSATVTKDARDNFVEGATKALESRAGLGEYDRQNPFNSYSLREFAREAATLAGANLVGLDPHGIAGAGLNPMAFGGHSTSDFPKILENVAYKDMMRGWDEAPETFEAWTSPGNLPDFKPSKRAALNLFGELEEMEELGEYRHGTIGERGEEIQLATYGKGFGISRKAIVNDDMNAFTIIPMRMGRAAKRTIGTLVYAVLTSNAKMSDGTDLFSVTTHKNAATGAALGVDTLDAARVAMATQKDPDEKAEGGLNIRPKYLLVPVALEGTARVLMQSQHVPGSNNNDVNKVAGMAEIISDARLDADSATTWYLAADPNAYDVIEVAYLNGVRTPTLERANMNNRDGVLYNIRIDAGVKQLDFRTLYRGQA